MSNALYRGTVVDNADPDGLGRVRLQVPQLMGSNTSGWAYPVTKDVTAAPVPGDRVWVTFEGGNLSYPLYLATGVADVVYTKTESNSLFDSIGAAAAAIADHLAASDPHPQYLTPAEGDALFLTPAEGNAAYVGLTGNQTVAGLKTFSSVLTADTGSDGSTGSLVVSDTGSNGANIKLVGNGATTPNKFIRAQGGDLQIINNGYTTMIASITDAGNLNAFGMTFTLGAGGTGTNVANVNLNGGSGIGGGGGVYLSKNGTLKWSLYSLGNEDGNLYVRDYANNKMVAWFQPGGAGASQLSVQDNLDTPQITMGSNLGDRIMTYGAPGVAGSYGFGIEAGTQYFKASGRYRWYQSTNATGTDAGAAMILTANDLAVKGNVTPGGMMYADQVKFNRSIDVSAQNLNSITLAGQYNGSSMTNAPDANWWYIEVLAHSNPASQYAVQRATELVATYPRMYERSQNAGTWGAWQPISSVTTPWTGVSFQNSWADYGSPYQTAQYRKVGDEVQLRGLIRNGTQGTSMFTLPAGFRPPAPMLFAAIHNVPAVWSTGAASAGTAHTHSPAQPSAVGIRVDVGTDGTVAHYSTQGVAYVDLSQIRFSVTA